MADIRIKDLASTATTTASDDFMAVDGTTNGTRKMNAAAPAFLTSVTTPSLTSPAATNLTLAGGAGNSSIILTPAGTGNVGIGTTTPVQKLQIGSVTAASTATPDTISLGGTYSSTAGANAKLRVWTDATDVIGIGVSVNQLDYILSKTSYDHVFYGSTNELMRIKGTGNVGIGTTGPNVKLELGLGTISSIEPNQYLRVNAGTYNSALSSNLDLLCWGNNFSNSLGWRLSSVNLLGVSTPRDLTFSSLVDGGSGIVGAATEWMRIASATGTVSILSTTAGSSGAGALVVTGGLSAGQSAQASWFGGNVNVGSGTAGYSSAGRATVSASGGSSALFGFSVGNATKGYALHTGTDLYLVNEAAGSTFISGGNSITAITLSSTGAATFAGAVTVGGNVGFYNNAPVAKPTGVAVTAAAIHAALVTLNLISA